MQPEFPVNTSIHTATTVRAWLLGFLVREDAVYEHYQSTYQARTAPAKILYLFLYLQYTWVLIITFGWHMFVPFVTLKFSDKLSPREILEFLGLNRVDWHGLFLVF